MIDPDVRACAEQLDVPIPVTKGDLIRLIKRMRKTLTVHTRCLGCGWEAEPATLNIPGDTYSFSLGRCDHCPKDQGVNDDG